MGIAIVKVIDLDYNLRLGLGLGFNITRNQEMSGVQGSAYGTNDTAPILPSKAAEGPGFLGPNYNPADEMSAPAEIGVHRGDNLNDVMGAVKGVVYYTDMIGFGESSSPFTKGMPGLRPLGVNYFINTGSTCSNGATMWEYISLIPDGSALGTTVQKAIKGMGLPQLRGLAPGIIEDAKSALNPSPIINAVVGSGYPRCKLTEMAVGDVDGKITNKNGDLLVDPTGLISRGGRYYQQKWIQDTDDNGDPVQLPYEDWDSEPKIYREDGCLLNQSNGGGQPKFCGKPMTTVTLPNKQGTTVQVLQEGFCSGSNPGLGFTVQETNIQHVKLAVSVIAFLGLCALWRS